MEILKIENLCKNYGKNDTLVKALDNINFSVNEGEFIAIVGASGSGKSTLMHIIGAVDKPTSGNVFVENINVFKQNETNLAIFRRRKVGQIFLFYNLVPINKDKMNINS